MTTILAVQGDGWAALAADSLVSDDAGRRFPLGASTQKIVKRGPYYIAAAGDVRGLNILAYVMELPAPGTRTGSKLDKFIVSKFIPAMKGAFEQHGYAPSDRKEQAEQGSSIIIIVNATVYHIGYDYSWLRNDFGVYYAGSGGDVAVGAFTAICDDSMRELDAESTADCMRYSIEIAAMFDIATECPVMTVIDRQKTGR